MGGLYARAAAGLVFMLALMGALLFPLAGTLGYWQAWALLAVYGVGSLAMTVYLARRDPALLERRTAIGPMGEKRAGQRALMYVVSLAFLALLAVSALDHRFAWSAVPPYLSVAADVLAAAGLLIIFRVFRENGFSSTSVEVADGQRVISSGPYAVVRHPMYSGALLFVLAIPVALGSWWGLLAFVPLAATLVWRTLDEEQLLRRELAGYTEYTRGVRYRLLPRVW
ncbi:methyltransferase family protein [Allonocardiopsis opalescens]|uniref:Protein-S-isoprenylcysteine O-methyltransferase Ste14 n=1 Tax=Allonocardiopsis opalescens TaxID=1144618 RepID=A0A2T0QEY0_9ACTN|nr:isoprenylcysteine carboxylmethyltransferase family protein [Allonocardiopsis opalescens]PRY02479.1 protein-S-isoprenylcysteine O-methyltransferase Ste14 [Allonocardiopsis opalescens]